MSNLQVLLVAGTHGNEINAPWVFDQWKQNQDLIDRFGLKVISVIGNPLAFEKGKRYLHRDLNRSFSKDLLNSENHNDLEISRAKELLGLYGPNGKNASQIAIDFHSTTACMGSSLVIYGRRPADLAIVSLIQHRIGLPVYLHEGNPSQKGFLVEAWPCGFVVEIGPVPQGSLNSRIIQQTFQALKICLEEISKSINSKSCFPDKLIVHRHLKSIDFPRDSSGEPIAYIHGDLDGRDWQPIKNGYPLFEYINGDKVRLSDNSFSDEVFPVFINEAAYAEKNIAMSFTKKEVWRFDDCWKDAFYALINS